MPHPLGLPIRRLPVPCSLSPLTSSRRLPSAAVATTIAHQQLAGAHVATAAAREAVRNADTPAERAQALVQRSAPPAVLLAADVPAHNPGIVVALGVLIASWLALQALLTYLEAHDIEPALPATTDRARRWLRRAPVDRRT